ncbi:MAG: dihydrolipoyl dehydrogenase [Candidatus Omnitrophota bacterium]
MNYDLTIIGAGWAGFNAALKAKELGLKVCLIEKSHIGGTCLNVGCIPTKALIHSAKVYSISKKASGFGIEGNNPNPNFAKIQERKDKIIQQLQKGMQFLLKDIDYINAEAKIISNQEIHAGGQDIKTKFILIACGSKPTELKNLKFDGKKIISSDDILKIKEIPKSLLVIGGGVIGCEFTSLFSNLGTQVSIVEMLPQLLPGVDNEVAKKVESLLKKKGIKINTNSDATTVDLGGYDLVLLCIGRAPNAENLELEKIGVKLEKGKIIVDDYLKTSVENIYAAGDCTGKTMLAHYAAYQGTVAAENISKPTANPIKADNTNVPNCIFTDPEISSVGLSENAAKSKGIDIKMHKFDFMASGMAHILDETDGFVKIISDNKTERVLGASIIGPKATELIAVLTIAISTQLKTSQIKDTIFAHPTLSESIEEALKH